MLGKSFITTKIVFLCKIIKILISCMCSARADQPEAGTPLNPLTRDLYGLTNASVLVEEEIPTRAESDKFDHKTNGRS